MSDLDLSVEDDDEEGTEAPASSELPPEVRKHMDRQARRIEKLQREVAEAKLSGYRDQVKNIVQASGLPPAKWAEFAETVSAQIPADVAPAQTDQATDTPPVEEPSEAEQRLAAVAQGPGPGAHADKVYSLDEIGQIGLRDPARAERIMQAQMDSDTGQLRTE